MASGNSGPPSARSAIQLSPVKAIGYCFPRYVAIPPETGTSMSIALGYPLIATEDSHQSLRSVVKDFPHLRTFPHRDPGCNVLRYDVVTGFCESVSSEGIFPAVEPTVPAHI